MYAWLVNLLFHLINTIIFYFKEYRSSRLEVEELKSAQALQNYNSSKAR